MKNIYALSEQEIAILLEPFACYASVMLDYCFPIQYEEKMKILNSIMDKTENISPMTVFTKREYSVMFAAMLYYENVADTKDLTPEFYRLMEKIKSRIG